jgi:hypothetical protein
MLVQRYKAEFFRMRHGLQDFEQKAVGLTLRQIQPWHHKHTIARLCAILPRRSVILISGTNSSCNQLNGISDGDTGHGYSH